MRTVEEVLGDLQHVHKKFCNSHGTTDQDWKGLENQFHTLLNQCPDHPGTLFSLGTLYMQTDRAGAAIAMLKRCTETGATGSAPWLNMAGAYKVEHNDEKAEECYQRALQEAESHENPDERGINVDKSHALHGLSSLHINAGRPQKCIKWAEKALKIDPDDRFAAWNKGLALLELGQYGEGFDLYDSAGFKAADFAALERKRKDYGGQPKWEGEPGKTVITYGEQGLGDEVMFASLIPDLLKDAKVIVDCDHRLKNLFERSFPGIEAAYTTSAIDAESPWVSEYDDHDLAWCPMGSLGKFYRRKRSDFPKTPFLVADPDKRKRWRQELEKFDGLKVGISYAGGLKKTRFDQRTIKLSKWADILQTNDCHWFSLQYHPWAADEAAKIGSDLNIPIHHWGDVVAEYDETAAFVKELDLVITVNTSLLHLCGSLGVPTWCLTPKMVAWRYGIRGPNPWYGSVKMYRQKSSDQWEPVLHRVARDLRGYKTSLEKSGEVVNLDMQVAAC